nr:immunoglobulin light chain junction region [Macaca mulatta]
CMQALDFPPLTF